MSQVKRVKQMLGARSLDELKDLHDEIIELLMLYDENNPRRNTKGRITGQPRARGFLELKTVKKQKILKDEKGEPILDDDKNLQFETVEYGPYLYLRRWVVDKDGKRKLKNIAYYGKAGAEAIESAEAQRKILEAHEPRLARYDAAESIVDDYSTSDLPERRRPKLSKQRPAHPLGDDNEHITLVYLEDDIIFQQTKNSYQGQILKARIAEWEHALRRYNAQKQAKKRSRDDS